MRDFEELVKALNEISDKTSCYYCHGESLDCKTAGCYISDAADAIEELLAAVPKWISVEERLPEPYQNVLTCAWKLFGPDRKRVCGIDYVLDNGEWACGGESYKTMVTHWMPLPAAPKEVTGDA